jgi:predicted aconitase
MGVQTTCTCTPYLVGNRPQLGQGVAWAESSAVSFANSVLGARTNREGGPSALAAALTGRTAAYGLHLEANRRATLQIEVHCPVESPADLGALGYLVGRAARVRVPYFQFRQLRFALDEPRLKALGAAMAASGAVALYHVAGVTPEARAGANLLAPDAERLVIEDLRPGYAALSQPETAERSPIDLVWIGCPHASLDEIEQVVGLLDGRRAQIPLWITCARQVQGEAERRGLVEALHASGGQIVADTCVVVAPMQALGFGHMATPSAKGAFYGPSHAGLSVSYGSLEACVEAAVCGRMPA